MEYELIIIFILIIIYFKLYNKIKEQTKLTIETKEYFIKFVRDIISTISNQYKNDIELITRQEINTVDQMTKNIEHLNSSVLTICSSMQEVTHSSNEIAKSIYEMKCNHENMIKKLESKLKHSKNKKID